MVLRVSTVELMETLPDVLAKISDGGESIQIERDGILIATIVPATPKRGVMWSEFAERYARLPHPDEDFANDVSSIRDALLPVELPEWPS